VPQHLARVLVVRVWKSVTVVDGETRLA
jgi:hypothetical protein